MTLGADWTTGQPENTLGPVSIDFGSTASTAAVFTQLRGNVAPMDPEHVQLARRQLIELIMSPWPAPELRHDFVAEARKRVTAASDKYRREMLGTESELDQLVRWIQQEAPEREAYEHFTEPLKTEVLDEVWVALAEFVELHEPLQQWGHLKLHEILHRALRTPAFVQNHLVSIALEGERTQVNSVLMVEDGDITRAELTDLPPDPASGRLYFRDLKRRTLRPVPLPPALAATLPPGGRATTDALVGQVYRDLRKRILRFAKGPLKADKHRLSHVIITYPTTTPPAVRQRLRDLVREELGVSQVTMRFDEGVAALMFVLMRDFGGDDDAGIETFRARSRKTGEGHWRQNLLVIDIGGGTTDIALTKLELNDATRAVDRLAETLAEAGPDAATEDAPRTCGRVYFLNPQVLGSTGHQQYGGDLLTLRVFYWIKALIADAVRAMVTGQAEGEQLLDGWPAGLDERPLPLAQAVTDYQDAGPAPGNVARYLHMVLPTATAGVADTANVQLTPGFELLWGIAETAKRSLADGIPYQLVGTELSNMAGYLDGIWQAKIAALAASGLQLKVEDFERLARAVLTPAIDLAVDLAGRCLQDEPGELLDGIALTGRAAGLPLVRELVLDRLAEVFGTRDRGGPIAWNPVLVTTEHDHPKEAASIGACWAQAKYGDAQKSLTGLADGLPYKSGRDQLLIKVDNLVVNLPCRFGLGVSTGAPLDLLSHGHPLDGCDMRGQRFTRTGWHPAAPDLRLLRFLDQQRYIMWGRYEIENHLGGQIPDDLYFQIQVDDQLVPTLHLCRGRSPHYGLEGTMMDLTGVLKEGDCLAQDGSLRSLPWDICVYVGDEADGDQDYRKIIDAIPTVTEASFRHRFAPVGQASYGGGLALVKARISGELPALHQQRDPRGGETAEEAFAGPGQREYTFAGIIPGKAEPEWTLTVPATQRRHPSVLESMPLPGTGNEVSHWAVMSSSGQLYLPEPGYPRYKPAADLRMMLNLPGSVFSTPMEPPQPDLRRDWDPFSGEH